MYKQNVNDRRRKDYRIDYQRVRLQRRTIQLR